MPLVVVLTACALFDGMCLSRGGNGTAQAWLPLRLCRLSS